MDAEVVFEYEPTQEDELALKVGVIIKNVKEVDDGWCEGEVNGKRGMFPDNFVKLRPASTPSHPPPASQLPAAPILRNIDTSKKIRRAKVTFSYAADNGDELTLEPGQVVEVLEEEEEGWWKGRIGNSEGVFPSNFVEEITEEEVKTQPPVHQPAHVHPPAHPPQPAHPPAHHPQPIHPPAHPPQPVHQPVHPPQPVHQPVHQPSPEAVDLQTGERGAPAGGEGEGFKPSGIRGPKVMPAFDPTKARAGLKKASVAAPPLEKPPEHKKVSPPSQNQPPKHPEKSVEQAMVTFDYEADNGDELTISVGEVVDVVSRDVDQDGWWEVALGGRKGFIPSNFVELIPQKQPVSQPPPPSQAEPLKQAPMKPPLPKEVPQHQPLHPPPFAAKTTKKPEPKKFPPTSAVKSEPGEDQTDFPVPKTTPLNSQLIKERPKNKNRPPSRSNLLANHEPPVENPPEEPSPAAGSSSADSGGTALSPWQAELKAKKRQPPKLPKPAAKAKPPVTVSKPDPPPVARSRVDTGSKEVQPPPVAKATPTPKPTLAKTVQPKPVETKPPPPKDTPAQSEPPSVPSSAPTAAANTTSPKTTSPKTTPAAGTATTVVVDNAWQDAYEKLKEDFEKFKEHMVKEIGILTDDLDKERKHRAGIDIDIDRLKKAHRSVGH